MFSRKGWKIDFQQIFVKTFIGHLILKYDNYLCSSTLHCLWQMSVSESLSLLGVDRSLDLRPARQAEEERRQRRILARVSPAPTATVPGPSKRSSALLKPRSPRPGVRRGQERSAHHTRGQTRALIYKTGGEGNHEWDLLISSCHWCLIRRLDHEDIT